MGNHYEKLGLKRISCAIQFTMSDTAGTSPDPAGNYPDTTSPEPNEACHTPDFSYPLVSSISFPSSSSISLCCPQLYHHRKNTATLAKTISFWAEWIHQSGRSLSEPSEIPRWQIARRPASIPRVVSHIALQSQCPHFFSLCGSPILNEHPGVLANFDHKSEWVL